MLLSPQEWEALRLSCLVSLVAVIASLPVSVALGWLLARRRFWGKTAVETLVNLPLVMPPVVTGYLLLVAFSKNGPLGGWLHSAFGIEIVFTWKAAALASAVVSFPLFVRSVRVAMTAVDERLEGVARTLGASPWKAFCDVTLALSRHGVVAGAVLAFARGLGEFGATIMVAGSIPGETRTVPLFVYGLLESPGGRDQAWRIVIASIVVSLLALLASEWYYRREDEKLARRDPWS